MKFANRHIGTLSQDKNAMLKAIDANDLDTLISETIPANLLTQKNYDVGEAMTEKQYLSHIKEIAEKNKVFRSYIGMGYYDTTTPSVILRNIFENPGWYTQYTPYQAEISQGRLESLLNFQTMITDLTGLPLANASLLDEATAAAEAMHMFHTSRPKNRQDINKFFVDKNVFPQTIAVLQTKCHYLGIELVIDDIMTSNIDSSFFGAIFQNPNINGDFRDLTDRVNTINSFGVFTCVIADIMSLILMKTPAEMNVHCAVGNTQRFGIPVGFGGPHAAYMATIDEFKRQIPGRIIGVTKDAKGNYALRMALQTREQHIKREKATSNICTAQALLANMAAMYALYHGPDELTRIATNIYSQANLLLGVLKNLNFKVLNTETIFDTITLEIDDTAKLKKIAESKNINFFYEGNLVRISINENVEEKDLKDIISVFEEYNNAKVDYNANTTHDVPSSLRRGLPLLTHPIFNSYHTETQMMRYIKSLEEKDLSLTRSMIPLGSCTMKLNAATELIPVSWEEFSSIHPFAPADQTQGYLEMIKNLERDLAILTGFSGVSLQPNSGAQGEYAGLVAIREYQESIGQSHRNIVLIPSSAHGTNPASGVLAGLDVVVSKADEHGNIDIEDLRAKAIEHRENLSCLMVTYPSTHGIFEEQIKEVCDIIHENGGQVYLDGANMNAQVGYTSPGLIGADVCHLNLHKTFAIPHGGGGPGVGPICVAEHLVPFLPSHPLVSVGHNTSHNFISAAPYGSASILLISYAYIKMLGTQGLKDATAHAILNANYIKSELEKHFKVLYVGQNNRVAHELIVDFRPFKQSLGIEVTDIAKRLMDYGIHAPTVSFPVAGTLMIEPTESEDKKEIDRFIDAMVSIKKEIDEIANGDYPKDDNVLVNAPHTAVEAISDDWNHSYSRTKAIYPLESIKANKFWISVNRVDDSYGDRNLICNCLPIEAYV